MKYTQIEIDKAINKVKHKAPIVKEFNGFIVLAQNELDYKIKCNKISYGDVKGFYTITKLI